MALVAPPLAFIFPSMQETILILVVGIMLFGRRLPEVGRAVAKTIVQLRQALNKLKEEMDLDGEVRDFKDSIRDVKNDLQEDFSGVRDVVDVIDKPRRVLKDPGRALMDLTDESLALPSAEAIRNDLEESINGAVEGTTTSEAPSGEDAPANKPG